jgi:hypothetical protein
VSSAAPSWMEEAGVAVLEEGVRRNPSLSDSYRPEELPRPNATVLDAQARVCTGPEQTRPLGEEQAMKVLDTILRSGEFSRILIIVASGLSFVCGVLDKLVVSGCSGFNPPLVPLQNESLVEIFCQR